MKKIVTLVAVLLISATILGQVPASFKYQAVLRDARGNIKANTSVGVLIDILQGSIIGNSVYSETHSVTTDSYGLINLELGNGIATNGSMSSINWQTGIYFVKVTVDGVVMGTGQLLSVPYALYASKAANGFSGNYNDLTNKPTFATVATTGSYIDLINKPTFATVATTGSYLDLINKPTSVTSVTGTAPVSVATGTTSPVISIAQASGTTNGYLSSADWTTFNNKSSFSGTWSDLSGKPTLAIVAISGSYNDLINKPALAIVATSGSYNDLNNKPTYATVATSGKYTDLINAPTIDGSETIVNSGTNVTVTGTGTTGNPYVINAATHTLGEEYGGGIVFFVYDGGQHGLIAAYDDLLGGQYGNDPDFRWFNFSAIHDPIETGTKGDGLGAGAMNTTLIVASQVSYALTYSVIFPVQEFAAKVCADYEVTITTTDGDITIGDWYLPSKYELDLLYWSQDKIGTLNLAAYYYWSSTEFDEYEAWYQNFVDGTQDYMWDWSKVYLRARVRPIRAF